MAILEQNAETLLMRKFSQKKGTKIQKAYASNLTNIKINVSNTGETFQDISEQSIIWILIMRLFYINV